MLIQFSSCQSRLVKNETPSLLWTIKRDVVDHHSLGCEQMLNHYGKTASFTTKVARDGDGDRGQGQEDRGTGDRRPSPPKWHRDGEDGER